MAEEKFIFILYDYGIHEGVRCLYQVNSTNTKEFFKEFRTYLPDGRKIQLHEYPANDSVPVSIGSLEFGVTHIFYESLEAFNQRQQTNSGEMTIKPEKYGRDLYYISQREGENVPFEKFKVIFSTELNTGLRRGLRNYEIQEVSTLPPAPPSLLDPMNTRAETDNISPEPQKTFNELLDELEIPADKIINSNFKMELTGKLAKLQFALRAEGDSEKNRNVIKKTKSLIINILEYRGFNDVSARNQLIKEYQQEISDLSVSQKVLIAAMTFLGALAGFVIGAVIGGVVSVGNPLAILAGGGAGAVVGAGVGGAVVGGGCGFLLSRLGVFKNDPVKTATREFVELVDDYNSTVNERLPNQ